MGINSTNSDETASILQPKPSINLFTGLLAFTMFVIVTTEFIVVGLMPAMAEDLNITLAEAGWLVTWFALAASVFGPPLTILAGRFNPRYFLILAAIFFSAGNFLITLAPSYFIVASIRLLQGSLLPSIVSVAVVMAVHLAKSRDESWAISRVNIGVVASTVIGVPVGAMATEKIGWPASFGGLAILGLISAALIAGKFPHSQMKTEKKSSVLTEISLLWQPSFLLHLLLSCILFAGMFVSYTYIAAIFSTLTSDGIIIGWMLMGFGIAGVFGNWLAGRVGDRDPLMTTMWLALTLSFSMAIFVPAGNILPGLTVLVIGSWGAAHMVAFVVTQLRVMKAGRSAQAFALSLNISVCNLGIALGAVIGSQIIKRHGIDTVGYAGAATVAMALPLITVMIMIRGRDKIQSKRQIT